MRIKVIKIVLAAVGLLLMLYALMVSPYLSSLSLGVVMIFCMGTVILTCGLFWEFFFKKAPWLLITVGAGLAIYLSYMLFIGIFGNVNTVSHEEDAVIVLGAGLRGERPSMQLARRLDAAVLYHQKNPDAVIVVSGGQGPGEDVSEAEAMKKYLIDCGVNADKIIMEDKSVSTYTNFKNSKAILDEMFGDGYKAAYITNDFHIFRAGLMAKRAGFEERLAHAHANSMPFFAPVDYTREFAGIVRLLLGGVD